MDYNGLKLRLYEFLDDGISIITLSPSSITQFQTHQLSGGLEANLHSEYKNGHTNGDVAYRSQPTGRWANFYPLIDSVKRSSHHKYQGNGHSKNESKNVSRQTGPIRIKRTKWQTASYRIHK